MTVVTTLTLLVGYCKKTFLTNKSTHKQTRKVFLMLCYTIYVLCSLHPYMYGVVVVVYVCLCDSRESLN